MVPVGATAKPFIDFLTIMRQWPPEHQALSMGAENWRLIESGRVKWTDVITRSRVRPFHEVVQRARLSVDEMVRLGVKRAAAEEAIRIVWTPEKIEADRKAKESYKQLRDLGLSDKDIQDALTARLVGRVFKKGV